MLNTSTNTKRGFGESIDFSQIAKLQQFQGPSVDQIGSSFSSISLANKNSFSTANTSSLNDSLSFQSISGEYRQPIQQQIYQVEHLDLNSFKVDPCHIQEKHETRRCPYYHNSKDRRRKAAEYASELCEKTDRCPLGDNCKKAHNQVEVYYSHDQYKKKYCQHYPQNISKCEYGSFCSFAHSDADILIELLHLLKTDAEFYMFNYKTVFCPFKQNEEGHMRDRCVYAHNRQDFRRKPNMFPYEPVTCTNWPSKDKFTNYEDGCPQGYDCRKCHGWKELDYHPLIYKTKSCLSQANPTCKKTFDCPLYHSPSEQRMIPLQVQQKIFKIVPKNQIFMQFKHSLVQNTLQNNNNSFNKQNGNNNNGSLMNDSLPFQNMQFSGQKSQQPMQFQQQQQFSNSQTFSMRSQNTQPYGVSITLAPGSNQYPGQYIPNQQSYNFNNEFSQGYSQFSPGSFLQNSEYLIPQKQQQQQQQSLGQSSNFQVFKTQGIIPGTSQILSTNDTQNSSNSSGNLSIFKEQKSVIPSKYTTLNNNQDKWISEIGGSESDESSLNEKSQAQGQNNQLKKSTLIRKRSSSEGTQDDWNSNRQAEGLNVDIQNRGEFAESLILAGSVHPPTRTEKKLKLKKKQFVEEEEGGHNMGYGGINLNYGHEEIINNSDSDSQTKQIVNNIFNGTDSS